MQHFENKYNVFGPIPQQAHMPRQAQQQAANHRASSSQQQQQQQQQQMQYQQQMNERSRQQQQQQMMLQQNSNPYYGNTNQQEMMFTGQGNQTSPNAFQWPPHISQHQGVRNMIGDGSGHLSFSPAAYYDSSQTDAEIDAILSNYQPKMHANMQSFGSSMMSDQGNAFTQAGGGMAPTDIHQQQRATMAKSRDQMNQASAAAAVAAYGHLSYSGSGSGSNASTSHSNLTSNSFTSDQADSTQWNSMQNSAFDSNAAVLVNGAGLDFQKSFNGAGATSIAGGGSSSNGNGISGGNASRGVAYDADASNTSSTQTPGGISSGDDSTGGKRRRMTSGGGVEARNQQDRFEAGLPTGGFDGKGVSAAQSIVGGSRPLMQHHGTSTIDSRTLEKMAQESLQRAGEDNARGMSRPNQPPRTTPNRPAYRHRRSNSGSNVHGGSSASTSTLQSAVDTAPKSATMHKKNSLSTSHSIRPTNSYPHQPAAMSGLGGFAASHPPGLGGHVLRGPPDAGATGSNAATEFTKRKGWPTRIVEELLDFVHVLDRQGRVLFASPSILTLTGWRADELKGRDLTDFVHPDDRDSVRLEFQRSLMERTEMTMYYRFQRKPQTAADKQRVHDQREAQQVSRSRSGSTSGNDSSSAPDSNAASSGKKSTFANGATDNHLVGGGLSTLEEEGGEFQDDQREKFVIFEATGHPYYSPEGSFPDSELNEEMVEELLPKAIANSRSQVSKSSSNNMSPSSVSIKKESPSRGTDGKEGNGTLDKGGGVANADIQCFFCSCRIYPTKNVGMLDSFLELKLENERLRMLLSELSVTDGPPNGYTGLDAGSDGRRSLDEGQAGYHLDYIHDVPDQQPMQPHQNMAGGVTPNNPTRGSLGSSVNTDASQQSIPRGPDRRDSTRSGSGGQMSLPTSPTLGQALERTMTGGTGVAEESDDQGSPNNLTAEEKRRKKKTKPEEGDYVCTDCGRVDSPEWRKGPLGPKTLCNACGLRWAKKVKRNGGDPNAIAMAAKPAKGQIKAQAAAARAQKQNHQYQQDSNSNGDSFQSGPSSSVPSSLTQQSNTNALKLMQQTTPLNNGNAGFSNQSPPNTYESNPYSHIYADPSSMGPTQQQQMSGHNLLSSSGMTFNPVILQQQQQQQQQHTVDLSSYTKHMQ